MSLKFHIGFYQEKDWLDPPHPQRTESHGHSYCPLLAKSVLVQGATWIAGCSVSQDSSSWPKSLLHDTLAAFTCMFETLGINKPIAGGHIPSLLDGTIKSSSSAPMEKTPEIPTEPFYELFQKWHNNEHLPIKDEGCLMAMVVMLRPSDIAPHRCLGSNMTPCVLLGLNPVPTPFGWLDIVHILPHSLSETLSFIHVSTIKSCAFESSNYCLESS